MRFLLIVRFLFGILILGINRPKTQPSTPQEAIMERFPKSFKSNKRRSSYQYKVADFVRQQYEDQYRDQVLENLTLRSFLNESLRESLGMQHKPFQLEDYIPNEYLEVG
jgi:hypothetical protein